MLDVHAPEHGIHGVRDFFIHLLTITVVLFIALSLENAAEAMHHRHLRREAETNILEEIRSNRDKLHEVAPEVIAERAALLQLLAAVEARSQGQDVSLKGMGSNFNESPIQDAAWRTASSTGVLSYMDYAEVGRFAEAYKEQALLETTEQEALEDYLQLMPLIRDRGASITPQMASEALPYLRRTLGHVEGMIAIGTGTLGSYEDALKH